MEILLHTCCGPCSTYPIKVLKKEGWEIRAFFYNPNIHPYQEFVRRLESLRKLLEQEHIPLEGNPEYGLREFLQGVGTNYKGRCAYCYRVRLNAAAKIAKEKGIEFFTSSLLISPYQQHDLIREIGLEEGEKYGVEFVYRDFRIGYRDSIRLSKESELYRQQYCGCIFSEEERYRK